MLLGCMDQYNRVFLEYFKYIMNHHLASNMAYNFFQKGISYQFNSAMWVYHQCICN